MDARLFHSKYWAAITCRVIGNLSLHDWILYHERPVPRLPRCFDPFKFFMAAFAVMDKLCATLGATAAVILLLVTKQV
jgi:hypothetical protein